MAIVWTSVHELEERLLHGYPPYQLTLRPFWYARPDAGVVRRWVPRESETREWEPGLGETDGWAGWSGDMPFLVVLRDPAQPGEPAAMGVTMPIRLTEHGVPDLSALLDLLAELPAEVLGATTTFVPFPFQDAGWGVSPVDRPDELGAFFRWPRHEEAVAVADLFNRRCPERPCHVVRVMGSVLWPWIVVGPLVGDFVSWSSVEDTRGQAEECAQVYSQRWCTEMRVYCGPVTGEAIATFRNGARVRS